MNGPLLAFDQWQLVLNQVDAVASEMELKWGVGRLPALVSTDLAQRFYSQLEKLNAALDVGSPADREVHGQRMINAWRYLDKAATEAGAKPISPKQLEGRLPDGRVLIVTDSMEGHHKLARENRAAVVWCMDEICNALWNFEMVNEAKAKFEGAVVQECKPTRKKVNWADGDDLPEGLKAMGSG
jgi:hypothetical protein